MRFDAHCQEYGTRFHVVEGGSMSLVRLRCNTCGEDWTMSVDKLDKIRARTNLEPWQFLEQIAGNCECGGHFRKDAKQRCPQCNSLNYEIAPDSNMILFD